MLLRDHCRLFHIISEVFFFHAEVLPKEPGSGRSSLLALYQNTGPQNTRLWRPSGLVFRRATGLWATETLLLGGSCRISQALRPKAEAVIRKDAGSDPLAGLGAPPGETGGSEHCPRPSTVAAVLGSSLYLEDAGAGNLNSVKL